MSSKMNLNWNTVFFMTLPVYFRNICRYFEQFYHSFKFQAHFTLFNILFRIILCWCFSAIWYIFLILQSLQIHLYKLPVWLYDSYLRKLLEVIGSTSFWFWFIFLEQWGTSSWKNYTWFTSLPLVCPYPILSGM